MPQESGKIPAPSAVAAAGPAPADWPAGEWLEVGSGHRVWWAEGGDPSGQPVLLVHGGPGGRSRVETLAWWQGLPVRWIAIDQRGCGRSTPPGRLDGNMLGDLLDDMARLQRHLGLARWSIAAGSWGATVALAAWLQAPERIGGLFLRSPFFGTWPELERYRAPWHDWLGPEGRALLGDDVARLERWLMACATPGQRARAGGADEPEDEARLAEAWGGFDDRQAQPGGVLQAQAVWQPAPQAPAVPDAWRVFAHYARHGWFLDEPLTEALSREAGRLRRHPLAVVCGALDACCDPSLGQWLADLHGAARSVRVPEGGHRMDHPAMAEAIARLARAWFADL